MSRQTILVITATLGDRPSLRRTVESVRAVGGSDVRHVIVAPASRVDELSSEYGIECVAEDPNRKGIYGALNYAFETFAHEHEFMTFINDDDFWLEDFRVLIDYVKKNNVDFVYAKLKFYDEDGKVIKLLPSSCQFRRFIELLHSHIVLFSQQSTLIRSSLFFSMGEFDESYKLLADSKFWALLSKQQIKFKYIKRYCAGYTIQQNQLSKDRTTANIENPRMRNELPTVSSFQVKMQNVIYRLSNLSVYFVNIVKYGVISRGNGRVKKKVQ